MKRFNLLFTVLFGICIFHSSAYATSPTHFVGISYEVVLCNYTGRLTFGGIGAVDNEDEVGVYLSDGETLGGACVVGDMQAGYYSVNVYAPEDYEGSGLIFKVWDKSEQKEYTIPPTSMSYEYADGFTQPPIPPTWSLIMTFGLLNLDAPKDNSGELSVSPTSYGEVSATSGELTFDVRNVATGEMSWIITEDADWFSVSPSSGINNDTITIKYDENLYKSRTGIITITASGAANSPQTVIIKQADPMERKRAIIVAGSGPYAANILWEETQQCADYAFRTLNCQGYTRKNIFYISADQDNRPILGCDSNFHNFDADATLENLKYAIESWASDSDELLIYLTGHGYNGSFLLNGCTEKPVTLAAEDLNNYCNTLQKNMSGRLIIVYDACSSGSFIPLLKPAEELNLDKGKRIVITSTESEKSAYFLYGRVSFSFYFWSSVFYGINHLNNIFEKAYEDIFERFDQIALIDSNSDGYGSYDERKDVSDVIIGWGVKYADFHDIQIVINKVIDNCFSAKIVVSSLNEINKVQAIIIPPGYKPASSGISVTDDPLIKSIELEYIENKDSYESKYDDFTQKGDYQIGILATSKDENNNDVYFFPEWTTYSQYSAPGDMDGNGLIDLKDAILVLKILAGINIENISIGCGCDINKDEKIGMEELGYILQNLSGVREHTE